jgi:hypothetical protein
MADPSKSTPTPRQATREAVANTENASDAEEFHVDRLMTDALALTGYEPLVVAGALANLKPRKHFTIAEVQAAAKVYLSHETNQES